MCTEMYQEKDVVARKPRKCAWCAELISKGERIVVASGKFDGAFFRSSLHPECHKATGELDHCEGYQFGEYKRGQFEVR